jgi:hypothetical protein
MDLVSEKTVDIAILKNLIKKNVEARYFLGDVVDELRRQYESM